MGLIGYHKKPLKIFFIAGVAEIDDSAASATDVNNINY